MTTRIKTEGTAFYVSLIPAITPWEAIRSLKDKLPSGNRVVNTLNAIDIKLLGGSSDPLTVLKHRTIAPQFLIRLTAILG